jgi:hypothetical protein
VIVIARALFDAAEADGSAAARLLRAVTGYLGVHPAAA